MRYITNILIRTSLLIFLLFTGSSLFASHTIGGDIVYRCMGNGRFEFTFTLYQDCLTGNSEAIAQDNPSYFTIFKKGSNVRVASGSTGTAIVNQVVPTGFSNECISNIPNTCMNKMVFRFNVTLDTSSTGYLFVYQRCCRNGSINNIYSPGVTGSTFSISIPPMLNPNVCPNNSAVFVSSPPQIICANDPLVVDFSATDMDGDSLSYELCSAYVGANPNFPLPGAPGQPVVPEPPYTPISYIPPYDPQNPLPSNPVLAINPVTGIMTGKPLNVGRYIVTVCVTEWRNGQAINTVSRDLQFLIADCSKNVIADIPELSGEAGVYVIQCDSTNTVYFRNDSRGGFTYFWDFGVPNRDDDTSNLATPTFTYPDTGVYTVKLIVNKGSTCTDSITKIVKVYPPHHTDFTFDGDLCQGNPIQFIDQSVSALPPIFAWTWDFGDGTGSTDQNPIHTYNTNFEDHFVTLISESQKGCKDSVTKKLVIPYFNPSAGNDTLIVKGYPFNMNGSGGAVYEWTPPSFLQNPADPKTATEFPAAGVYPYNLKITSEQHCVANDSVTITVVDKPWFIVPSGFTPNGDGRNDIVKPISVGYLRLLYFKIYNRYGQLVFQSYSFNSGGWDGRFNGKPADMGVYYWQAAAVDPFGATMEAKGDITLIR